MSVGGTHQLSALSSAAAPPHTHTHAAAAGADGLTGGGAAGLRSLRQELVSRWTMAAKEDVYSKILPRRIRQNRSGSVKCGSNLDVLLSMGFPRPRA